MPADLVGQFKVLLDHSPADLSALNRVIADLIEQMKPTVLVGAILKGYSVDESQVAASLWRKIRVFVDKARSYGVIVYTPIHINPETGSTRFATVYGTPDVSNVIEAELEILR